MSNKSILPSIEEGEIAKAPEFLLSLANNAKADKIGNVRQTVRDSFIKLVKFIDFEITIPEFDFFLGSNGVSEDTIEHGIKTRRPLFIFVHIKSGDYFAPTPSQLPEQIISNAYDVGASTFKIRGENASLAPMNFELRAYIYKVV